MELFTVVEGFGEVAALPELLRRLAPAVNVPRPFRTSAGRVWTGDWHHLELACGAARSVGGPAAVLVLLDTDRERCPAEAGPLLLAEARKRAGGLPCDVVLAHSEFETWFVAAAESLRGCRGLAADLKAPPDPEGIRDAKGWLSAHMSTGRSYRETLDQVSLAAQFDIEAARRSSPSLDKLCRSVSGLVAATSP